MFNRLATNYDFYCTLIIKCTAWLITTLVIHSIQEKLVINIHIPSRPEKLLYKWEFSCQLDVKNEQFVIVNVCFFQFVVARFVSDITDCLIFMLTMHSIYDIDK